MRSTGLLFCAAALVLISGSAPRVAPADPVTVIRVPGGGVQPEVVTDRSGTVHLVYLAGEARAANVFYARSRDGGRTFSRAVRVNSQDGSAIAAGTVRGAQIAVAASGRVHVVWNGSDLALPRPPRNPKTGGTGMPMLYARSNAAGTSFEPQRNLMTQTTNLDGGGSVAAIERSVYVGWGAHPADGDGTEDARRVWLARSSDEGATFSKEQPIAGAGTGVCGCCALRLFSGGGSLHALYRSATNATGRDVYALVSRDRGQTFQARKVHDWTIGACPMTTMAIGGRETILHAWETDGQVYFAAADGSGPVHAPPMTEAKDIARRKHPRLAVSAAGAVLLVWTEGTAWARGGSLAWQMFGADGSPTATRGAQPGIPVWGFAAVVARPDGGFTILY
jgi:hypothetical protein